MHAGGASNFLCPAHIVLLLLAALAWHVGIATKSLARDLGIGKRTRDIMRAAYVLVVFALVALVLLAS